jgi:hypothetical protein
MPTVESHAGLRQRAEYTHKYNATHGRHGWLRLTPAYSVRIVDELLRANPGARRILDPFSGTATTGLCAAYHGLAAFLVDINPFLVWLGRIKTARYEHNVISSAQEAVTAMLRAVIDQRGRISEEPPIQNIGRWWRADALQFLRSVKGEMDSAFPRECPERSLVALAFCRTVIRLSNAAFNHQSMSFKEPTPQTDLFDRSTHLQNYIATFREASNLVTQSAADNPSGSCNITQGDAREIDTAVEGPFDLVITSPPYPNRMSYIRELRPYMYWLGYLHNGRDAADLDWSAIGGTWRTATSRLLHWTRNTDFYVPKDLNSILQDIAREENPNGSLLSNYVAKYFEDIWVHLNGLTKSLTKKARVHFIVGNSKFYGVVVPTERLYADMLRTLGFARVDVRAVRKRNSKKELVEFDVSGEWQT